MSSPEEDKKGPLRCGPFLSFCADRRSSGRAQVADTESKKAQALEEDAYEIRKKALVLHMGTSV